MTRLQDPTDLDLMLELVAERGPEAMASVFTTLLNLAMKVERQKVLGVEPFERSSARTGQANGFKPKTIDTRAKDLIAKAETLEDRLAALKKTLGKGKRPTVKIDISERHVGQMTIDPAAATEIGLFCKEAGFEVISITACMS